MIRMLATSCALKANLASYLKVFKVNIGDLFSEVGIIMCVSVNSLAGAEGP